MGFVFPVGSFTQLLGWCLWCHVVGIKCLVLPRGAEGFQSLSLGFCFRGGTVFAEGFVAHKNRLCLEQSYNQSFCGAADSQALDWW